MEKFVSKVVYDDRVPFDSFGYRKEQLNLALNRDSNKSIVFEE